MSEIAKIILDGKEYELPIIVGSENEKAIDISKLLDTTGYITLDTGFKNTGATKSAITFLDGDQGILRYRGYPIEQLSEYASFIEVMYLIIYGELPTETQLNAFQSSISHHTLVHEDMKRFYEAYPTGAHPMGAYPTGAHPMGVLSSMLASLSTFYPESQVPNRSFIDVDRTIHRLIAKMPTIHRLIAKMPTLAAQAYKVSIGHPIMYPRNSYTYTQNFLHMMFALPTYEYQIDPVIDDALNKLLILHADHEQNCSTSTVRIVGSSQSNLYSSVSAGVAALWGPLHGGANQAVIEMLEKIKLDGGDTAKWIAKAKDKNDSFRLMGFGHRVYKNFDPRAKISTHVRRLSKRPVMMS